MPRPPSVPSVPSAPVPRSETGASVAGPLTASAVLLMLGAVLVLRRRRVTA
ncbi:LPXTG cell wall anchor domain-containing protein [Cryobacterium adonitolivorans]|uniref:LPXTG cell wall anchor domain-containing protein n=1 Tax=Cryobacterium adonitolivorans TaxID=1259189 RepID=A0A4V6QGP2_9MICO|nr:LPXTG cell wall anchor domain-containing protein [Cryobacterium adonitolivorans]